MKLLFITNNYLKNNANTNCLKRLMKALPKDWDIQVLLTDEVGARFFKGDEEIAYIPKSHWVFRADVKLLFSFQLNLREYCLLLRNFYYKFLRKLLHKECPAWEMKCKNTIGFPKINQYIKDQEYDAIISMSYPFECHHLGYKLKKENPEIKWYAYYLDPYFSNHGMADIKDECLALEDEVLSLCDGMFLTPILYREFEESILKKYIERCYVCEFPNLVDFREKTGNGVVNFDDAYINCVFTGHMYNKIRNPKFLFDLLLKADKKIRFYIVGGFYGELESGMKAHYVAALGDRLQITGSVDLQEALAVMNDADILVNIGNLIPNQLPSKIFDYMSTGKPIVNICKLRECPSLAYMEKYPLCLNVFEPEGLSDAVVQEFEKFCTEAKGKQIPFAQIREQFITSSPEYVAKQMVEKIDIG